VLKYIVELYRCTDHKEDTTAGAARLFLQFLSDPKNSQVLLYLKNEPGASWLFSWNITCAETHDVCTMHNLIFFNANAIKQNKLKMKIF